MRAISSSPASLSLALPCTGQKLATASLPRPEKYFFHIDSLQLPPAFFNFLRYDRYTSAPY